jgi:hypothetical protein
MNSVLRAEDSPMPSPLLKLFAALAVVILSGAGALVWAEPVKINVDEHYVAIGGYDTVAYFTLHRPTKGDPRFEAKWEGARWHFASAEHRDMFLRDPDRFAPRFGGFCAVGISRGYLSIVDPEAWVIVGDRLFLASGTRDRDVLRQNSSDMVENAEKNWPKLRGP